MQSPKRQLIRVVNDLIGVENERIEREAPGFVPDDAFSVLACCLHMAAVAAKDSCTLLRHSRDAAKSLREPGKHDKILAVRRRGIGFRRSEPERVIL